MIANFFLDLKNKLLLISGSILFVCLNSMLLYANTLDCNAPYLTSSYYGVMKVTVEGGQQLNFRVPQNIIGTWRYL